jgi:hypothetical protein
MLAVELSRPHNGRKCEANCQRAARETGCPVSNAGRVPSRVPPRIPTPVSLLPLAMLHAALRVTVILLPTHERHLTTPSGPLQQ